MPSADIDLQDTPPSINPYEVLSIDKSATPDQIKSAYRKAALRHHPDKACDTDKEEAHTKFQEVAFAYAILSDERRRRRYDATGSTSESLDLEDDDFNWADFFHEQFEHVISEDSINDFAKSYKGSEEEKQHVLKAYEKCGGNMEKLYEEVMLSDMLEDEDRFRVTIDKGIDEGEVEGYKKYTAESEAARKKRMDRARKRKEKEAKEASAAEMETDEDPQSKMNRAKAKKGKGDMGDLAALIQSRQKDRAGDFFAGLEAKYAGGSGGGKKSAKRSSEDEGPSEEAFAANRKKGKASTNGGGEDAEAGARRTRRPVW
ncbi:hypothetical protein LTS14_007456 [Recurvomyces mirabilis]|uniref:uncharacterized protein n=1 Tax=Recurvomyces mirabilis TaxID=574656 RepID=UPI002DDE4DF0|nr:hypothetical protein LTS14_007456 [Recurvomyces mirabilis]